MLAKVQTQRLVAETKFADALGVANLLPVNNNRCFLDVQGVATVTVVEEDPAVGAKPVAFGLFNKCTTNQLYCSIVVTSPNYDNKFVSVENVTAKNSFFGVTEENQNHFLLKISEVLRELPDLTGLPQYYSAFMDPPARPLLQTVVDELVERTVGHANFECARNLTVDLYDASAGVSADEDKLWRDFAGFVVADRNRYSHLEIARSDFVDVLKSTLDKTPQTAANFVTADGIPFRIEKLTKANAEHCIDYDQNVAMAVSRQEYLEYLFQLYNLHGAIAFDAQNEPVGYVISLDGNILQCYAEEPKIANQLLLEHVGGRAGDADRISLFVRLGDASWVAEALVKRATRARRVRRFHTRVLPASVKWSKVFALNIGVHLF